MTRTDATAKPFAPAAWLTRHREFGGNVYLDDARGFWFDLRRRRLRSAADRAAYDAHMAELRGLDRSEGDANDQALRDYLRTQPGWSWHKVEGRAFPEFDIMPRDFLLIDLKRRDFSGAGLYVLPRSGEIDYVAADTKRGKSRKSIGAFGFRWTAADLQRHWHIISACRIEKVDRSFRTVEAMTKSDHLEVHQILATLSEDRARQVWLELGRRVLSGEVKPEGGKAWIEREVARRRPTRRRPNRRWGRSRGRLFALLKARCELLPSCLPLWNGAKSVFRNQPAALTMRRAAVCRAS